MTVEELRVLITAETSGLRREMTRLRTGLNDVSRNARQNTNNIKSAFSKLKTFLVTLAIGKIIKDSIKSGMDAIESENLFDTVMGKWTKSVRAWSMELQRDLGLNAYEIRKNVGVLFNMTKSMGITEIAAINMSKQLTLLANDMASFYNISSDEAFTKLRAGITGETEPLKRIGILVDEATIKQYAYKNGIAVVGAELSQQQKVMARYLAIMDQTKTAQGDLARTIDSPANQLRILKTQLEVIRINLGMAFMPIVQIVIPILMNLAKWLVNVTNIMAEFSKALFGVSEANTSQASSGQAAANAQKKVGMETETAGKKASKATAGFDEINQLQNKASTYSGQVDTTVDTPLVKPNTTNGDKDNISDKSDIQKIAEKLRRDLSSLYSGFVQYGAKIKRAFSNIDFSSFKDMLNPIKNSLFEAGKALIYFMDNYLKPLLDYLLLDFAPNITKIFVEYIGPVIVDGLKWRFEDLNKTFINASNIFYSLITNSWILVLNDLKDAFDKNIKSISVTLQKLLDTIIKPLVTYILNQFILPIVVSMNNTFVPMFKDIMVSSIVLFADTFKWAVDTISEIYNTILEPVFNLIKDIVLDTLETVNTLWSAYSERILLNIQELVQGIQETFSLIWDEILEPIIIPFLQSLSTLWNEHITIMISKVTELVIKLTNAAVEIFNKFIKPIIDWLITYFSPRIVTTLNLIIKVMSVTLGVIADIVGDLFVILGGIIDFITGIFTGNWSRAWKGIVGIFKGIFYTIADIARVPLNMVIDSINYLISKMNKIEIDIPSWVPSIGGKSFGVNIPKMPKLARGGIIDSPTIAMIGEAGKEAVIPLENTGFVTTLASAVGNAVLSAMQMSTSVNDNQTTKDNELVIMMDSKEMARVLIPEIEKENIRMGKPQIVQI